MKNKIFIWESPIFVFKKIHKCPNCANKIIPKVINEVINSKSKEAKNYDFSAGDSYLTGDVKFRYYVFFVNVVKRNIKLKR